MATKERLHRLVDELSEREAGATLLVVERHRDDAMLQVLADAPLDDEQTSEEEDRSAYEALAAYRRGEAIDAAALKDELGFDELPSLGLRHHAACPA
jgi:hypothetical protein